jgi:hypothetical protein
MRGFIAHGWGSNKFRFGTKKNRVQFANQRAYTGCVQPTCLPIDRSRVPEGLMKPLKVITLLMVLVFALVTMQAKPKKPYKLPAAFEQARYVYVEAEDGQEFNPRLDPDDRQAIADVDDALYAWNRYIVTTRRDQADLIFVVRKGRLATAKLGGQVSSAPQGGPGRPAGGPLSGSGVAVGGEVGPPDDFLEVYLPNPNEARGALLWQRTLADGLNPPQLTLFKQLKDEVERTYPNPPPNKTSKP